MISSESNAQMKELVKLQKNVRYRKKTQLFVAEGRKMVAEAKEHGCLEKVYVSEPLFVQEREKIEPFLADCEWETVEERTFRAVSDTVAPQGMLGLVRMPQYEPEKLLRDAARSFLLLEDLRDPGNLGTIMRTAEGAGMSGVILSAGSVDLFNPKVVRATMGAIFRVPFYYAADLAQTVEQLKARQIPVLGAMMEGSVLYDLPDYRSGAAIVIGNEANGISQELAGHLSGTVRIPMEGKLESLNAAVSAALLMYEIARQRRVE